MAKMKKRAKKAIKRKARKAAKKRVVYRKAAEPTGPGQGP